VGWPTWLTRALPDEAESGGGLQVATTQLAITIGAALGGRLFDLTGAVGVYIGSSVVTLLAALVAWIAFRNSPNQESATVQPTQEKLLIGHG
jgi:predicted MFS family arabinose efflux permease